MQEVISQNWNPTERISPMSSRKRTLDSKMKISALLDDSPSTSSSFFGNPQPVKVEQIIQPPIIPLQNANDAKKKPHKHPKLAHAQQRKPEIKG